MRVVLIATMAASVLAIGLNRAQSLPPGGNAARPDSAVRLVQQKEMGPGPASPRPSMGPGMGGPSMRSPSQGGPIMGPGPGGGKMRGEGGAQFRSGERGMHYRPRMGERDRGHMRRHYGGRGFEMGPRFGYVADCGWLRRRALDTGSRYWWRQYRACMH